MREVSTVLISVFCNFSVTDFATSFARLSSQFASFTKASTIFVSSYSCLSALSAESTIKAKSREFVFLLNLTTFNIFIPPFFLVGLIISQLLLFSVAIATYYFFLFVLLVLLSIIFYITFILQICQGGRTFLADL